MSPPPTFKGDLPDYLSADRIFNLPQRHAVDLGIGDLVEDRVQGVAVAEIVFVRIFADPLGDRAAQVDRCADSAAPGDLPHGG